jgi:hypothetical protein
MAKWGTSDSTFDKMAENPAAPAGMKQAGERYTYAVDQFQQGNTSDQPWLPQNASQMAKNWYTGQNTLGVENGWDTPFYQKFFAQDEEYRRKAAEAGTNSVYYQQFQDPNKLETGIALWDDPNGKFKVGDVFVDGQLQEGQNVYESLGEEQASWLLGSLYQSGSKNKELFKRRDQVGYAEDVRKVAAEWSQGAKFSPQVDAYEEQVDENAEGIQEGFGDNLIKGLSTLGGIAGGFGTGFTAGAVLGSWTGPGSIVTGLVGGIAGGVLGGVAGWDAANANQDQLTDLAARVVTRQQQVEEHFDGVQEILGWGHTLEEASALGMKFISPAQNFVHGLQEKANDSVGDGTIDWNARDAEGNQKAGLNWKMLDLAAAVSDGVGQFGSPVGKYLYTGVMAAGVAGRVMGDVGTDQNFDEVTGGWHEYEDWKERGSAYGSIGIDALQTAVPGLMSRAAKNARQAAGLGEVSFLGKGTKPAAQIGKLDDEVVGATRYQKALDPDTGVVTATGKKWTLESLVPSELARKVPVGFRARQLAKRDGTEITPDHFYRAAYELTGGSQWKTALTNAYAEGVEEFTQAYLDEWSYGRNGDFRTAMEAAAYGAAGGLGMGMGQLNTRPSRDQQLDVQRRRSFESKVGRTLTDEEWASEKAGMSKRALEMLDVRTPEEDAEWSRQREATVELMQRGQTDSPIAQAGIRVLGVRADEDRLRRANQLGGDALMLMGQQTNFTWVPGVEPGDDPEISGLRHGPNTSTVSFSQAMTSLANKGRAVQTQLKDKQEEVTQWEAKVTAATAALNEPGLSEEDRRSVESELDTAQRNLARYSRFVEDLQQQMRAVRVLLGDPDAKTNGLLVGAFQDFANMTDIEDQKTAINDFNELLKNLYAKRGDVLRDDQGVLDSEAVKSMIELLLPRHPLQDMGSFNVQLPQVSLVMTRKNSHRSVGVHQAVLKALGGDHDGDTEVQQFDMYIPPEMRANLRRGLQYMQYKGVRATELVDEDGKLLKDEAGDRQWEVNIDLPSSEEAFIDMVSSDLKLDSHTDVVNDGLARLKDRLLERYVRGGADGRGPKPLARQAIAFEEAIDEFIKMAKGGVTDARVHLAQKMWDLNGEGLFAMSDATAVPEIMQLWVMITSEWENIRVTLGMHKYAQGDPVDPGVKQTEKENVLKLKTRSRLMAANIGQTIAGFGAGPEPRASQFLHYQPLRQASIDWGVAKRTETMNRGETSPEMAVGELYALLGSGQTESDLDANDAKGRVKSRVINWLDQIAREFASTHPTPLSAKRLYLLIASMEAGDFRGNPDVIGQEITMGDGPISLLQLLLRRSIQIEENINRDGEDDSALSKQLKKLRAFTEPQGPRSTTAAEAMVEVLGDINAQELLGGVEGAYFGQDLTMRQYVKLLLSMSQKAARREWGRYKTRVPAYLNTADKSDPIIPVYTIEQIATQTNVEITNADEDDGQPQINAYTILVDTVQTAQSAARAQRKSQGKQSADKMTGGLRQLHEALDTWFRLHTQEITALAKAENAAPGRRYVFRHMLAAYPDLAETIAELVPDASMEFVFQLKDGHATAAKFMEDVLMDDDLERAVAQFYVYNKLAEWAALQETPLSLSEIPEYNEATGMWKEPKIEDVRLEDIVGRVHPSQIKSRFLETMYYLSQRKDGGHEYRRFMKTVLGAQSLEEMFDEINSEAVWLFGRADLLPFNDSVQEYELMPSDLYSTGTSDTVYRERLDNFATTMQRHAENLRYSRDMATEFTSITQMMKAQNALEKQDNPPLSSRYSDEAHQHLVNLDKTIEHAKIFGDLVGPRIREQIMEAFDQMLLRLHDKGKSDERIVGIAEARATVDTIGFGTAMVLEFNSLHAHSWDSVAQSPTALVDGPIRIMLKDGSQFVLDLSTREGALEALSDVATQQFAVAVLFPIMRDINDFNVVQAYTDSQFMPKKRGEVPDLGFMLQEAATNVSLFNVNNDDKYKQSMRLIAFIEGQRARAALDAKNAKDVMDGYYPIMRMINDILEAYQTTSGTGRTPYQREQLRRALIVQMGDALKMIGQLDASQLDETKSMLFAIMQERMGETKFMDRLLESETDAASRELVQRAIGIATLDMLNEDAAAAKNVYLDTTVWGSETEIAAAQLAWEQAEWKLSEFRGSGNLNLVEDTVAWRDWESAQRMFKLQHTEGDKSSDHLKKIGIVSYLLEGGRINKFEDIKESVAMKRAMGEDKVSWAALLEKLLDRAYDPQGGVEAIDTWDLEVAEWDQLSLWATLTMMSERAGRSSSDTKALWATSKTVADFQRMHDASWSFLLDELFSMKTHAAMDLLTSRTGKTSGFYEAMSIPTTQAEIAARLSNTILSDKVLGDWNPSVVVNMLKMDLAMRQARSSVEIPKGGNYPKIFGPINGVTSDITFEVPGEEFMTAFEYSLAEPVVPALQMFAVEDYVLLHNHFVREVAFVAPDGTVIDLMPSVTDVDTTNAETKTSGLQILNMLELGKRVDALREKFPGASSLRIVAVDTRKQPFNTPQWANNRFFDGRGRDAVGRNETSLIASMIFGTGGESKLLQQGPLNVLSKNGEVAAPYRNTNYEKLQSLEEGTVFQVMMNKAWHVLTRAFPTSEVTFDDLPALYQYIKMHHVVVGRNPDTGQKEVWWSQDYIQREIAGTANLVGLDDPSEPPKLVALEQSVADRIYGGSGYDKYDSQRPTRDVQDLPRMPDLSQKHLEKIGLSRLGETAELKQAPIAQFRPLPASNPFGGTADTVRSYRELDLDAAARRANEIKRKRDDAWVRSAPDRSVLPLEKAYTMLRYDPAALGGILARMGVPGYDQMGVSDVMELRRSARLYAALKEGMDARSSVWEFRIDLDANDYAQGFIGRLGIEEIDGLTADSVAYGDTAVIDLQSILAYNGMDQKKAADQAIQVVDEFAKLGVKLMISSSAPNTELRRIVSDHLTNGPAPIRYQRGNGTAGHFFEPVFDDRRIDRTRESYDSDATALDEDSTKNLGVAFIPDGNAGLNENVREITDRFSQVFRRIAMRLIPTHYTLAMSKDNVLAFALPKLYVTEQGDKFTEFASQLVEYARSEVKNPDTGAVERPGEKELLRRLGAPKQGTPIYTQYPNGTFTPGIRSPKDALKIFIDTLAAGNLPLAVGSQVMTGDLYLAVSPRGEFIINRVGYELPRNMDKLNIADQWAEPLGGPGGPRLAVGPNKPDNTLTHFPPFRILEVDESAKDGILLKGEHDLDWAQKMVSHGLKTQSTAMPDGLTFAGDLSDNGTAIGSRIGGPDTVSKAAGRGRISKFRNLWALTGVDFTNDLVRIMFQDSTVTMTPEQKRDRMLLALNNWANLNNDLTGEDAIKLLSDPRLAVEEINRMNAEGREALGSSWVDVFPDGLMPNDPESNVKVPDDVRLMQIFLITLSISGMRPEQLISTPGLLTTKDPLTSDAVVGYMPDVFTSAFQSLQYHELRQKLIDRANNMLPTFVDENDNSVRKVGWFDHGFKFHAVMRRELGDGRVVYEVDQGYLQLETPLPADENSINLAFSVPGPRDGSLHLARTASGQGIFSTLKSSRRDADGKIVPDLSDRFYGETEYESFDDATLFYDFLTRVAPPVNEHFFPAKYLMPLEHAMWLEADEKMGGYIVGADRRSQEWPDNGRASDILKILNLSPKDLREVDYLVRQFVGAPAPKRGSDEIDSLTYQSYVQATEQILANLQEGLHPLHGGDVPIEHHGFWYKVYQANKATGRNKPWTPLRGFDKKNRVRLTSDDWSEWVTVLMAQVQESDREIHGMFASEIAGFFHTYQNTDPSFVTQPLTMKNMVNAKLADPDTNELFISIDSGVAALAHNPPLLETMQATWKQISGHSSNIYQGWAADSTPASTVVYRAAMRAKWLERNGIHRQKRGVWRDYAKDGLEFKESLNANHIFLHSLAHISIVNRLFNFGLWVGAPIEIGFRNMLERTTDALTGTNGGWSNSLFNWVAGLAGKEGPKPKYNRDQQRRLRLAAESVGGDPKWRGQLMGETNYQASLMTPVGELDENGQPIEHKGKKWSWGAFWEKSATRVATIINDPTFGMRKPAAARRYIQTAIEYLDSTNNYIDFDVLMQMFETDSLWLMRQFPKNEVSPHSMGANAVGQVRATRGTLLGDTIMRPVDKLFNSPDAAKVGAGLLLKIPLMFTRFQANAFLTLTGLGSLDSMAAMALHNRQTAGSYIKNRYRSWKNLDTTPPEYRDYTDVLETLDMERTILRGAVSQTGFALAAMYGAQVLGLGGEDEEERKRRLRDKYLRIPPLYDPREAENGFEYADAIWLDEIPVLGGVFETLLGRDMGGEIRTPVIPHWILRQFTSPLMGIVRAFSTGEFSNIRQGFLDAASVIPNSLLGVWRDADYTAGLILNDINELQQLGVESNEVTSRAAWMLMNFVGIYEKALFENQMVNTWYIASDPVDRNPFKMPETTKTGELVKEEGTGFPVQTKAMQATQSEPFVDPVSGEPILDENGDPVGVENRLTYAKRSGKDGLLHQYTESNFTAAAFLNLLPGQGFFFRDQMVPKKELVPVALGEEEELQALVYAAFYGEGGQDAFTKDEIGRALKYQYEKANIRWSQPQIDKMAAERYREAKEAPLTIWDPAVGEIIAADGTKGVFRSLLAGAITFDAPALQGAHFPMEMRQQVAKELLDEIVQESIDMGMSPESAEYRKRRLWFGDQSTGQIGLRQLVFSNSLPYKPYTEYTQLNVTYAVGPDGKMWATPFTRANMLGAIGVPVPHSMAKLPDGLGYDTRGNVVNYITQTNTGGKAIVPALIHSQLEPDDSVLEKSKDPKKATTGNWGWSGGGYRRSYGGYGGGGYGGGGGYSDYGTPMFTDKILRAIRAGYGPQMDGAYAPNFDNPIVRRADVRRERVSSERGRLKQWQ